MNENASTRKAHILEIVQKWTGWLDEFNFESNLFQGTERYQVRNSAQETRETQFTNCQTHGINFEQNEHQIRWGLRLQWSPKVRYTYLNDAEEWSLCGKVIFIS